MDDLNKACFLAILVLAIIFLVWGFMDLMKKPMSGTADLNVISRQLRGFALIMLSQVILVVGGALCMGGFKKAMGSLRDVY